MASGRDRADLVTELRELAARYVAGQASDAELEQWAKRMAGSAGVREAKSAIAAFLQGMLKEIAVH